MMSGIEKQKLYNQKYSENLIKKDTTKCDSLQCRTKTDIWKSIEPITFKLKYIYDSTYSINKPKGMIVLKYKIYPHGNVDSIDIVKTEIKDYNFVLNVKNIIANTKFSKSKDTTVVTWPFYFSY
jgi:hypothetical protein